LANINGGKMETYKVKDINLASQITEGQIAWFNHVSPITSHYASQIAQRDYIGKTLAYWGHITSQNMLLMMTALKKAGTEIVIGACNVDSTDDVAAAYIASLGISIYAWKGMTQDEYDQNKVRVRKFNADYLCDMGGELSVAYMDKIPPVKGSLEATTSGLTLLKKYNPPFPIFDWNSIPLKDRLENRFHVGDGIWPVFSFVTGMGLFGRRVLVIGYGPVGKGIAERARNLGAIAHVADLDPVRLLEARHHGCEVVSLEEGLARCQIIVTATGVEGVLSKKHLIRVRQGAILFNAGHSNREIDINWLYQQPNQRLTDNIERFDIGKTYLFLLSKGSLLNLAAGAGPHGVDMFDLYTAVMLLGIAWMFDGIPSEIKPGLQPYPAHLEREIAELSVRIHNQS
jgi:adenosylhomocysteinase